MKFSRSISPRFCVSNLIILFLCCVGFSQAQGLLGSHPTIAPSGAFSPSALPMLDQSFAPQVVDGNGRVSKSVVQSDGKIISVGLFYLANGVRFGNIVRLNPDGSLDSDFNGTGSGSNAEILAMDLQSDGKILIGGIFTSYDGHLVTRLARLNANGSFDSTFSSSLDINGQVNDIAIQSDGKILIGGTFNGSTTNSARGRLTRLNSDGTLDVGFNPGFPGASGAVNEIFLEPGNTILVGGQFDSFNGVSSKRLVRLTASGAVDATLNSALGPNGAVSKIVRQEDGKILIGGFFTRFGTSPCNGLARLNSDGSLETAFVYIDDPTHVAGSLAFALESGGKIVASYTDLSGSISKIIRLNINGTLDDTFHGGSLEAFVVRDVFTTSNGQMLVGGDFESYAGVTGSHLFRMSPDGDADSSFSPSILSPGVVYVSKQQADGKMIIAGNFEYVNGARRSAVARLNIDGSLDNTFDLSHLIDGYVYAVLIRADGKIVIGGNYITHGSFSGAYLTRINADGSFDKNLNPTSFLIQAIYGLDSQSDGKIVATGDIRNLDFTGRFAAIRTNVDGTLDSSFTSISIPNGTVQSVLVQPTGKIIIGGNFSNIFPFARSGIARLNSDGSLDSGFSSGGSQVYALAQTAEGKIYAGGDTLRRYNAAGELDPTFSSSVVVDAPIRAIVTLPAQKCLIGGKFSTYNGGPGQGLISVQADGSRDTSFDLGSGVSRNVYSLSTQNDGKLLIGGEIIDVNGVSRAGMARLRFASSKVSLFDYDGDGKTDESVFRPTDNVWYLNRSQTGFAGYQFGVPGDLVTPADFTGDGKTDIAVFRPSAGAWFILRSEDNTFYSANFGAGGDMPAPGDFDGDGKADTVVFRPSTGYWFLQQSTAGFSAVPFGTNEDVPTLGDFDGDGKSDVAVFRPSTGVWYRLNSSNGSFFGAQFGQPGDKVVAADYSGDGKSDLAVWRPSNGTWYIQRSEDNSFYGQQFGASGDLPTPGDYDGDGKTDVAVFRPGNGVWFEQRSTSGFAAVQFGANGDKPTPNAFVY